LFDRRKINLSLYHRTVKKIKNSNPSYGGSDVAGLRTTAKKTPDGKHYIVNGIKKW
jgi:hypothetical protein